MRLSSASKFNLFIFLILGVLMAYAGCGGQDLVGDTKQWLKDLFGPSTPREAYHKLIKQEGAIGEQDLELWDAAYGVAKTTALRINTPHREIINLDNDLLYSAQAMRLELRPGRRLRIRAAGATKAPLFGEIYTLKNGRTSKSPVATWDTLTREITYESSKLRTETIILVTQSAPWQYNKYELQITTEQLLQFPVQGKDEKAIQSFWGAARDGGKRKHEGNDIFAPKGTPLLALTDGEITRVNNGGLGGKTVWLYDADRDLRYYYAHLDEHKVRKGQFVRRGDVVGTVGNTGNARTTPPHLHFGIYARGAIDPYSFLQRTDDLPPKPRYSLNEPAKNMRVPRSGSHSLRLSPERDGTVIRKLVNGEPVTALGVTGKFYRVITEKGEMGYANFD